MVVVGETETEPDATEDWLPIPLSMLKASAPLVVHVSVADAPPFSIVNARFKGGKQAAMPHTFSPRNDDRR